ncbi:G2-specific protein kinase nimA-like [Triticum dicoccoides]|uniref:G2-specific protein kinase nimA-like n=1 Tax=Triticum dicoccoides TaxID=85692 RepID=UPI000E7C56D8|nr:G2-specific protein kinase nimA-like [Triticum dicoccoides]
MEGESLLERIVNGDENPRDLPLALLRRITDDFSAERKIGQGGFGEVYKGLLPNGINVAVKRMHVDAHTVDDRLFRREIISLMTINHQNVVRFLGFCSNTHYMTIKEAGSGEIIFVNVRERLLCLEYISNGSLDKHITDELRGLEWETRYKIITGICKGLCYLHEEKNISHMDFKPANILLDDHMVPKITDFGLTRPNENSTTMGQHFGTRGYLAPEYENTGKISVKSDIYSLGAIILELVTGCMSVPDKNNVLRRWRHRWNKPPTLLQYQQVTRCLEIALQCRQQEPEHRPSISEIVRSLSQISPCFDEDDMLDINPLELWLPSVLKKEISCSIELTNNTRNCIAFNIQLPSIQYSAQPDKGIVQPESKYHVQIKVQARDVREHDHADKFIVQSMKLSEGLRDEVITENMFHQEAGEVVDEVNLMVVYGPMNPQKYMPAEVDRPYYELEKKLQDSDGTPMSFPLDFLKAITCNFSSESILGEGGFGEVYKGVLSSGSIVAVKKLFDIHLKEDAFQNEVCYLMGIKHPNVVQLLGYCAESIWETMEFPSGSGKRVFAEKPKRLICFEYVCNKSLDKHISDESSGLDWNTRYEIIKGICNGLHFLHEECRMVHLDLKPENILMDSTMMPKIADFGLSRIFGEQQSRIFTNNKEGTLGYMAPEYRVRGVVSYKADIFSFGVIVIEIITGGRDYPWDYSYFQQHSPNHTDPSFQQFTEKVLESWKNKFVTTPNYKPVEKYTKQVRQCVTIALKCVDPGMEKRPNAKDIIEELKAVDQEVHDCI